MGKSRTSEIKIGIRFTQRLAEELRQSATYAARNNMPAAKVCYETAVQMFDTFLQETGLQEYLDEPTAVAPKSKQAPKRKGNKKPVAKRTTETGEPSDGAGD